MALLSFGQSKTKQNATSRTTGTTTSNPWAPTTPLLNDLLGGVGAVDGSLTPDQLNALDMLKAGAVDGNPWAGGIGDGATAALSSPDRTGMVGDAYDELRGNLGGFARGDYVDVMNNPEFMAAMKVAGDDASDRINQLFAGGGRMYSDTHAGAVGRGVTTAQAPLLADQYNLERNRQIDAAKALYGAGNTTATTQANLDSSRAALAGAGAELADRALAAEEYGPGRIFDLEALKKSAPLDQYKRIAEILFPAAGLGGTTTTDAKTNSSGTSKSKQSGFSLKLI